MVTRPITEYPGKVDPVSPAYPDGEARDVSAPGAGDGTPLQEKWVNDVFGTFQALLKALGVAANNTPEQVGNSQILQAITALAAGRATLMTDTGLADVYDVAPPADNQVPPAYAEGYTVRFTPANDNTGPSTLDVDGLGVVPLVDRYGNPLTGGELRTDTLAVVVYNAAGAHFRLQESARGINIDARTVSGNYTPPAAARGLLVFCQGAGGGGGGNANAGGGAGSAGVGGGGGGCGIFALDAEAARAAAPIALTIGAGGAAGASGGGDGGNGGSSTFGAFCTAGGGQGGSGHVGSQADPDRGTTGNGTGGGGSVGGGAVGVVVIGEHGNPGFIGTNTALGGRGGGCFLGGQTRQTGEAGTPQTGRTWGGGGGGSAGFGGGSAKAGAVGADGIILIVEVY